MNGGDASEAVLSRRAVLGSSALVALGLLSGAALGAEEYSEERARAAGAALAEKTRRRMEDAHAFGQRLRDATPEQRVQIMQERTVARHQERIEEFKAQLGCSDAEWKVIQPRIEAVYNLQHALPSVSGGPASSHDELSENMLELRNVLNNKSAEVAEIRAKLTAVRAAKEKFNQKLALAQKNLRQVMTVRQEALLVLNGLLD